MTLNGWIQIGVFAAIILLITAPLGGYMTAVFNGERTFLSPLIRPVERLIYRLCGVNEKEEQHWTVYTVAMLMFSIAGFVSLYALQRLQGVLPFNPNIWAGVGRSLAFNTSVSFVTNTNWQSYVRRNHHELSDPDAGADGAQFRLRRHRHRACAGPDPRLRATFGAGVGNFWVDLTRATLYVLLPISVIALPFLVWQGVPQNLGAYTHATGLEGVKQIIAARSGRVPGSDQDAGHQWRRLLQRQFRPSVRESHRAHQSSADVVLIW